MMIVTERVEIRPPMAQRVYIVAFGVFWCGFLAVTIVGTHSATSVVPLIMLALGATMFYRMFQLSVIADETELLIRNHFGTKHVQRSEIEDFRASRAMGMPFGKAIHVLLRNGEIMTLDVTIWPWLFGKGLRPDRLIPPKLALQCPNPPGRRDRIHRRHRGLDVIAREVTWEEEIAAGC
jgi:hypothetical protein